MSLPVPPEMDQVEPFWSEGRVKLAAFGAAGGAILLGLYLRFDYTPELPPMPPKPVVADPAAEMARLDETPEFYREYVARDSGADSPYRSFAYEDAGRMKRTLEVAPTTPEELSKMFPYELSSSPKVLAVGDSLETGTLKLSLRVESLEMRMGSEGAATFPHFVLRIENKSDRPVAFNVTTSLGAATEKCGDKAEILGNALALPPRGVLERTECSFAKGRKLTVEKIEAMELPALSFHYVSRLNPAHIGLDKRFAFAHQVPIGKPCSGIPEQAIRSATRAGTTSWRDVIDFYGRHNCDTYNFPIGYRAFSKNGQYQLPATPSSIAAASGRAP